MRLQVAGFPNLDMGGFDPLSALARFAENIVGIVGMDRLPGILESAARGMSGAVASPIQIDTAIQLGVQRALEIQGPRDTRLDLANGRDADLKPSDHASPINAILDSNRTAGAKASELHRVAGVVPAMAGMAISSSMMAPSAIDYTTPGIAGSFNNFSITNDEMDKLEASGKHFIMDAPEPFSTGMKTSFDAPDLKGSMFTFNGSLEPQFGMDSVHAIAPSFRPMDFTLGM